MSELLWDWRSRWPKENKMDEKEDKQRCEKCGRRIRPRWKLWAHDTYVGPTCKRKYVESGQYNEEDFVDTKAKRKSGN